MLMSNDQTFKEAENKIMFITLQHSSLRVEEHHNTPIRVGEDHNFIDSFSHFH
jgi:hypothetical protein